MALKRALKLSVVQTGVRLFLSFASVKLSALYIGAPGLALTSQLSGFIVLSSGVIGHGIQTAVTRLTPEYQEKDDQLKRLWSTATRLIGVLGGLLAVVVVVGSYPISVWLLHSGKYWYVIALAALAMVSAAYNAVFNAILTGLKRLPALVVSGVSASVLGFAFFAPLTCWLGLAGALLGVVLTQALSVLVSMPIVLRESGLQLKNLFGTWDWGSAKLIIKFIPMLVANATASPLALILIRGVLASELGLKSAGLWQAAWRVSEMYTMVISSALSLYLIPHLASLHDEQQFKRELLRVMGMTSALCAGVASLLYLLRPALVHIVFAHEFMPMLALYPYQLIGDVLMMAARPLRMALVVKMQTALYVVVEFVAPGLMVVMTYALVPLVGIRAPAYSYIMSNIVLLGVLVVAHFSKLASHTALIDRSVQK